MSPVNRTPISMKPWIRLAPAARNTMLPNGSWTPGSVPIPPSETANSNACAPTCRPSSADPPPPSPKWCAHGVNHDRPKCPSRPGARPTAHIGPHRGVAEALPAANDIGGHRGAGHGRHHGRRAVPDPRGLRSRSVSRRRWRTGYTVIGFPRGGHDRSAHRLLTDFDRTELSDIYHRKLGHGRSAIRFVRTLADHGIGFLYRHETRCHPVAAGQ